MAKRIPLTAKIRFKVFNRDGFTCVYCGRKSPEITLHVDHVIPVARGGSNHISNLVSACMQCNLGKRTDFIESRIEHFLDFVPIPLDLSTISERDPYRDAYLEDQLKSATWLAWNQHETAWSKLMSESSGGDWFECEPDEKEFAWPNF